MEKIVCHVLLMLLLLVVQFECCFFSVVVRSWKLNKWEMLSLLLFVRIFGWQLGKVRSSFLVTIKRVLVFITNFIH